MLDQKQRIMRELGVDAETAEQVLADDKAIDRGEPMPFDLTAEQAKVARKAVRGERKAPTVYKFNTRQRKENTTKSALIADLAVFLEEKAENVQILNKERLISFKIGENDFEITLTQKRKPKN